MDINSIETYCINLKERKNKKNYIKKHFKKFGILNYKFFFAEKHENPIRGCLQSHLAVIKLAIQNDRKRLPQTLCDLSTVRKQGATHRP